MMRSPKDILLLLLAGIVCGFLAMVFWQFFGVYGFAIITILVSSGPLFGSNSHRRRGS
jgi:TRAP-type C4-dicarboxylate transport system permease small subunit